MAVENDPSARPLVRLLPLRAAGIAVALSLALSLGIIALWRFAPGLLPGLALLLAWAAALLWGMFLAARHQGRESEEARRRLEGDLALCVRDVRDMDSLRQEVDGYRRLFESRPEPKAPVVPPSPGPAPANVHNFIRDPLTGLFHRRYFEASVEREIHRMERRNLPLGIILMRLDTAASEELLRAIGALLNRRVRGGDVASHHDGGIFGLILPEAPLEGVRTRAEQLRSAVREIRMGGEVTLSLGVAAFPDCGHSSEKLLRVVRTALDEAMACGGDCVAVAPGAVLDRRLMLPD